MHFGVFWPGSKGWGGGDKVELARSFHTVRYGTILHCIIGEGVIWHTNVRLYGSSALLYYYMED